jgi:hypothetical protein
VLQPSVLLLLLLLLLLLRIPLLLVEHQPGRAQSH